MSHYDRGNRSFLAIFHPQVSTEFHLREISRMRNASVSHSAYPSRRRRQGCPCDVIISPVKLISATTTVRDNRSHDHFSILETTSGIVYQRDVAASPRRRERPVGCNTSTPFAASRCDVSGPGTMREYAKVHFARVVPSSRTPGPRIAKTAGGRWSEKIDSLFHIFGVRRFQVCTSTSSSAARICHATFC